ncbi:MAG: gluconokinase [Verrucomicrobiota bacterium]|jgi:gluconokinase
MPEPRAMILMGVAGSGKAAAGSRVAKQFGWLFLDADDFHPAANVEKMKHGIPLDDNDRAPWLDRMHSELRRQIREGRSVILACSALKDSYRDTLKDHLPEVRFVFLDVDRSTVLERLQKRQAHFFPKELLDSQLATLESPHDAFVANANGPIEEVVGIILEAISTGKT